MVMSKEQLFMSIMIFFAAFTAIVGLCNEAEAGAITLADLGSLNFGGTIPGQVTPDIGASSNAAGVSTLITVEDFTNASTYNKSTITQISRYIPVLYDPWTQTDGTGYVLTGSLGFGTTGHFAIIGVQKIRGLYDVTYYIDNSINSPFNLDISYALPGYSIQAQFTTSSISIREENLPSSSNPTGTKTIGLAAANQYGNLVSGISTVQTIYDPVTGAFTLNINGGSAAGGSSMQTVLDPNNGPVTQNVPPYIFAGVECPTNGFVVQKIVTNVQTADPGIIPGVTGIAFIDAILQVGANLVSAISQFGAMLSIFFGMGINPSIPFWIWAIVGIPCIATLFYMALQLIRGTG